MGSVDEAEQFLEPNGIDQSLAWFKKIGMHFIFRSALNAYIGWKNESKSKIGFMEFLQSCMMDLLHEHIPGVKIFFKEQEPEIFTPTTYQFVKWEKIGKRKNVVYVTPKRGTAYFCPACPEEPGLCSKVHDNQWHGGKSASSKKVRQ